MYVYMCVCICVCIYIYMCVCVCVYIYTRKYVCTNYVTVLVAQSPHKAYVQCCTYCSRSLYRAMHIRNVGEPVVWGLRSFVLCIISERGIVFWSAISSYFGGNNIRFRTLLCLQSVGFMQINNGGVLLYCLHTFGISKFIIILHFKFEVLLEWTHCIVLFQSS